ncbi:MAG: DNA repair protein RecO [Pirellulaceae bacterium]|nr:DNA repair protein RecO [Pirellulaceae bacterium]
MSSEKSAAIVLKNVDFSETSSIVTIFTEELGKIQALAKGARRPKGPFANSLCLLSLANVVFIHKSSDSLDLLTEAKLERYFRGADFSLLQLYTGYYLAELVQTMTDNGDPHKELFGHLRTCLEVLGCQKCDASQVALYFEIQILDELGYWPVWESCASCGTPLPDEDRSMFGILEGGVLCAPCRVGRRNVVKVSSAALSLLKLFQNSTLPELLRCPEFPEVPELRRLLGRYISHILGRPPRMFQYLPLFTQIKDLS